MKKRKFPENAPRYRAGRMELKEGTGKIICACSCGKFLEMYKEDTTFRILTPEGVDPDETNPNAPWVASVVDDVGSSSPAVARVLLQGQEIISAAMLNVSIDKVAITGLLHDCKEAIVVCEKIAKRVASRTDKIIEGINEAGIQKDNYGRGLNPFPQILGLKEDAANFLIHAKRAIQAACKLPAQFLDVEAKDTNFDRLAKTIEQCVGAGEPITTFIHDNAEGVRYLIELRNFQEHPEELETIVDNFRVMPDGKIRPPIWHVSNEEPQPISPTMLRGAEFLIEITETLLIHLVMHTINKNIPFVIVEIDEGETDPKMPIKYRLSIADTFFPSTEGGDTDEGAPG